jgi:hypothetical protein
MKPRVILLLLALLAGSFTARADEAATAPDPARDADRRQLLAIMSEIEQGINSADIERMVKHIDETGIVTWLNAEVSQGPEGVRQYFRRMIGTGAETILSKYVTHPKLDGHARFYGDVAVANGTTVDEFTPHRRSVFKFDSRWTGTLVKRDGVWKIVALNLSTNTFNNVLIHELQGMVYKAGGGGLIAGLVAAGGICYLRRRRSRTS